MPPPNQDQKPQRLSYSAKNDFMSIPSGDLPAVIDLALKCDKILNMVGPAGIGKTEMTEQACRDNVVEWDGKKVPYTCRPLLVSQLVPEDINGIPVPDLEKEVVKFLKLELLPKPSDPPTLLFLDEINQGDITVIRTMFQLLGERRIGSYRFAPHHRLMAAMNPDGENYQTIKPTPALRRRMLWVEVTFDPEYWFKWAESNTRIHPAVLGYCRSNVKSILNLESLNKDKVFANPASWEHVSKICYKMDELGKSCSEDKRAAYSRAAQALISGAVGAKIGSAFIDYLANFSKHLNPDDILKNYAKVKPAIKRATADGRVDMLSSVASSLVYAMLGVDFKNPASDAIAKNVAEFFADLNNDTAVQFGRELRQVFNSKGKTADFDKWNEKFAENPASKEKLVSMMKTFTDATGSSDEDEQI